MLTWGDLPALRPARAGSAQRGDAGGDRAEVSRGHSTENENRGAGIGPFKLRNPQARTGKDRTNIGEPTCAPSETRTAEWRYECRESDTGGDSELPWIHIDRCPRTREPRRRLETGEGEQGRSRASTAWRWVIFPPSCENTGKRFAANWRMALTSPRRCAAWKSPKTEGANAPSAYRRCWIDDPASNRTGADASLRSDLQRHSHSASGRCAARTMPSQRWQRKGRKRGSGAMWSIAIWRSSSTPSITRN